MIKEIRFVSGQKVVSNICTGDGIAQIDLTSVISTLDKCVEQYCLVIDIVENKSYVERKQNANRLKELLETLTKREYEVLKLAILGYTNKSIAESLCISLETVKSHRKKIVGKIGVRKVNDLKDILLNQSSGAQSLV